jgi:hypothetical protein
MECLCPRVQDIDFFCNELVIRDGQGAKDRITILPQSLKAPLQDHLKKVKAIHERHLAKRWGRVQSTQHSSAMPGLKGLLAGLPLRPVL